MAYSSITKPGDYFNTVLYTGNDSTQSITGVGFQPDLWWNKSRSGTHSGGVHCLYDSVRGVTKRLKSDSTDAEATISGVTAFDSDGVTLGSENQSNGGSTNYVAWNWKAGGTASSNTDGSITTTVSANQTAGFSVFTFTGTGSNATLGHGLNAVPEMYILKRVDASNNWRVYHKDIGNTKYITLEQTGAAQTSSGFANNTDPTSSVISVGNLGSANASGGTMLCYAFAPKKGYSKFGSYEGNGNADGPFVYTGFKPAFVLRKNADAATDWAMIDSKRPGYNVIPHALFPNLTNAETTSSGYYVDLLSNGFKVRGTSVNNNTNNQTYIYMAFAAEPLVANVGTSIPATAI